MPTDPESDPASQKKARVVHCKREPFDVYIGRPSKWGNPFVLRQRRDRQQVIALYRTWLAIEMKEGRLDPRELRGKILGCWCAPLACHGDVLLEVANAE